MQSVFTTNITIWSFSSTTHYFFFQPTNASSDHKERKKKESIVDLSRYLEKVICVKFAGGREVSGILKGYDPLVNLVLDNTTEHLRG